MFYRPKIDFLDLPCDRLPAAYDGLVLLHLSDMHVTHWSRRLSLWRKALAKLKPHIVLITGDLSHRAWLWKTSLTNLQKLLEPLAPPLGTYFILGNHDSAKLGPALAQTADLAGHPRIMLRNQSIFITKSPTGFTTQPSTVGPDKTFPQNHLVIPPPSSKAALSEKPFVQNTPRLALIGIHQHRRIDTDIPSAMASVHPADFKLMMLHYPDLVHPAIAAGADICLAGHTHGGQICWPDGRPLFRQDTLPPQLCTGVHRINGTWMVVNRGIGAAGVRMRLFCPPQALQLTLRSKSA